MLGVKGKPPPHEDYALENLRWAFEHLVLVYGFTRASALMKDTQRDVALALKEKGKLPYGWIV